MKILVNEKISQHKYKTPEGYLICVDSVLARTGNQTYRKNELFADSEDDSEIEVGRSPEEVFSAETLASFENKPITIEHPDEDVNVENYKDYSVGFVRDVKKGKFEDQDVILGTLVITDKDAIEGIENGEHVELSCGYDCDIEDGADGYQQKHIRGNHVALCEAGRAGIAKIIDSVVDEDIVKYKGYTLKFHKGYNMRLNMKDYYEVFDERGNKVAMKKDLKSAKEYVDNGGFKDSVGDAKKYAVEFTYDGDSVSNYLGQVWVYANSDKEALKKAEQWAKNKYDDAWNFKIVPKAYSNSEVIDSVGDAVLPEAKGQYKGYDVIARHVGYKNAPTEVDIFDGKRKVKSYFTSEEDLTGAIREVYKFWPEPPLTKDNRNFISNYLRMISGFVKRKDTDIQDILRPLYGKGFKPIVEKIEGWIWKKDAYAYKNYYISLEGYKDTFLVTLYADPAQDWDTKEVNAYFTDSIKDFSLRKPAEIVPAHQEYYPEYTKEEFKRKLEFFVKQTIGKDATSGMKQIEGLLETVLNDYRADISDPELDKEKTKNYYKEYKKIAEKIMSMRGIAGPVRDLIETRIYNIKDSETPDEEQTTMLEKDLETYDVDPRSGESKDDFIARFMKETKNEYPDEKQRLAVAYSYWENKGRDSMVKDAKQTFEIRWIDQYQKSKGYDKSFWLNVDTIKADTAAEALEKLKNIAVMRGTGTRYITIVNMKEGNNNYQLSGNVDEVIRRLNDSKPKDSIYALTVQGEKSKKLVRAKDAREAIDKYTRMFPKHKVSSVKKTDKFNKIIGLIKR